MSPRVHGSVKRAGFIGRRYQPRGRTGLRQIDWDVPAAAPVDDPESPGHKCLIARSYTDSGAPENSGFFVPGEFSMWRQRNLAIVASTHQALTFRVNTLNPASTPATIARVKLRAILDLKPHRVRASHRLEQSQIARRGFQQLRTGRLNFGF